MTTHSEKPQRRHKHKWLKRIGLGFLVLFILLAIFHRPLFFQGTRYLVIRAAKQQQLDITYDISGSIFTTLHIEDLKGTPIEPGPIQRLEIGSLDLQYSLWGLIADGPHAFLRTVEAKNVYIDIRPAEESPDKPGKQSIKFPALFPERLVLENVNFISRGAGGNTELSGLTFTLYPDEPGVLELDALEVPGVRRWENVSAITSFQERDLIFRELVISPEIKLVRFNLDASKLGERILGIGADGQLFGAQTSIRAVVSDLNKTNHLDIVSTTDGALVLDDVWEYLNLTMPVHGTLLASEVEFKGLPERPVSWAGKADVRSESVVVSQKALGRVTLTATLGEGHANIVLRDELDDLNTANLEAKVYLPETLDGFRKIHMEGKLELEAQHLSGLSAFLPEAQGNVQSLTEFTIVEGKLASQTQLTSSRLAAAGTEITGADLKLVLARNLATREGAPFYDTLEMELTGKAASMRFKDYVTDAVDIAMQLRERQLTLETLTIRKGENNLRAQGSYTLPGDMKSWLAQPIVLDLDVQAPDLSQFVAPGSDLTLAGDLAVQTRAESASQTLTTRTTAVSQRLVIPGGELTGTRLTLDATRDLTVPQGAPVWQGLTSHLQGTIASLQYKGYATDAVVFDITTIGREVTVNQLDVQGGPNTVTATGTYTLPEPERSWLNQPLTLDLDVDAPRLEEFKAPGSDLNLTGSLQASSQATVTDGKLNSRTTIKSGNLSAAGLNLSDADLTIQASWDLNAPQNTPFMENLQSTVQGKIGNLQYKDYAADSVDLDLGTRDGVVDVKKLDITRGDNTLKADGSYSLDQAQDALKGDLPPLNVELNAPQVEQFFLPGADLGIEGNIRLKGTLSARTMAQVENDSTSTKVPDGEFQLEGTDVTIKGIPMSSIRGDINTKDGVAKFGDLVVEFDGRNSLRGSGQVLLQAPYTYSGEVNANFADVGVLKPVLARGGKTPPELGGALKLDWQGEGSFPIKGEGAGESPLARLTHSGEATVDVSGGRYSSYTGINANAAVTYSRDSITAQNLRASAANLGAVTGDLNWQENRLQVTGLNYRQGGETLVQGTVDIPLRLGAGSELEQLIPASETVNVDLRTGVLNIREMYARFLPEQKPPLTGTVQLDLQAQGTLDSLAADLELRGNRLQSTTATQFAPAEIAVNASLRDDRLTLDGTLRQPLVQQPITLSGNLPLNVAQLVETRSLDRSAPLDFQVNVPRTSLAVISTLVPAVQASQGTAEVELQVGGTINEPTFNGALQGNLAVLRFEDPSLPPFDDVAVRADFTENSVALNQFTGRIAGGSFSGAGTVDFAQLDNPLFNLRLAARNALVLQNDSMTVRTSGDLRLTGPLNSAALTGEVFVTRGRFYKDVDILPIGLPGRPAPGIARDGGGSRGFSFTSPPLSGWTFDVAISTADPFLIQGNLANGRAVGELQLGGTGAAPWLDGNVVIEELTASLPFSRLNVESGIIYFTRDDPFVPKLNIRATSTIRSYDVQVYVQGTADDPKAVFTSDPPLTQADVVSLIATGTTTEELSGDPNALAGRGAILLFQKLYRSVFKRNDPVEGFNSVFSDRVKFEIGATDPHTGAQGATARVPLAENLVLVGGVSVDGNFRGQVKYLVRFK